jgi:hypothetical protein
MVADWAAAVAAGSEGARAVGLVAEEGAVGWEAAS